MNQLIAQVPPITFWGVTPGSPEMWLKIAVTLVIGFAGVIACTQLPAQARRGVVWIFTFAAGLFYFLLWIVPQPINRAAGDLPRPGEEFGFFLSDALPKVADVANILTAFLLGLGIYSLLRVHIGRIVRRQPDREFSALLLGSMVVMVGLGYADWITRRFGDPQGQLDLMQNWMPVNFAFDLFFDGLLQQMDAAMFSMIAFFILSAAYRAFRIRSVESTVLMGSALILMLSLLGALVVLWNSGVTGLATALNLPGASATTGEAHFLNNFKLNVVADWVRSFMQVPALRALEFGVGLGALAMGLRLWLGLERGGVSG
ncbi:MAG: hypothetical protein KIT11_11895 [Fimbriimonadaceae bacterium]|nr:hypothetical protein [Fimbriimonadaceae bacterium]QYK55263.1 MAG: hypothetical protein KF733_09640 [Fimbriimonadaceae bacterium]